MLRDSIEAYSPLIRLLLSDWTRYWKLWLVVVFSVIAVALSRGGWIYASEQVVGALNNTYPYSPTFLIVSILALGFFSGAAVFSCNYFTESINLSKVEESRDRIFKKLLILPESYYQRKGKDDMIAMVAHQSEQLINAISKVWIIAIREGLTIAVLAGYAFWLSWKLTLLFIVCIPMLAAIFKLSSYYLNRYAKRIQDSIRDMITRIGDFILNRHMTWVYEAEKVEQRRFSQLNAANCRQMKRLVLVGELGSALTRFSVIVLAALPLYMVHSKAIYTDLSIEKLVSYFLILGMLPTRFQLLARINTPLQRARAAADGIDELLEKEQAARYGTRQSSDQVRLSVKHLSYRYPSMEQKALDDVSFTFPCGRITAISGPTGSGKSTLLLLLLGFLKPEQGNVYLNEYPFSEYSQHALRRHIAYVGQRMELTSGSIASNIRYSNPSASMSQVQCAASLAGIDEFVQGLKHGYASKLSLDVGQQLSGGQKQRLLLARALLKKAQIIILDEVTSAQDKPSERRIMGTLKRIAAERTVIVVAHRLSTIREADHVIFLNKGRITAHGGYEELLQHSREFQQFVKQE